MATSVYTSMLLKDYKRKAGEIKALRKEVSEIAKVVLAKQKELSALGTIIHSREPAFDPHSIKPIATLPKVLGLKWNQQTTLVLEKLRISGGKAVLMREIVDYVIEKGEIQLENRQSRTVVRRCILDTLRRLCKKGTVVHCYDGTIETEGLWSLPARNIVSTDR
ncbi:MAG: hypothetical protein WC298_00345 [Sideroxydans sp.]|jgi:hypothetical protein